MPKDLAGIAEREQNFGRVAAVSELETWLVSTMQRLEQETKQERI